MKDPLKQYIKEEKAKRARRSSASKLIALAIPTIIGHTNARFVLSNPFAPHVLTIHGPSLRKHLSPKMTARELDVAIHRLRDWGIFSSIQFSQDMYVVALTPPIGMKPEIHDYIKRPPISLDNIAEIIGDGTRKRRKARVVEMAVERMNRSME